MPSLNSVVCIRKVVPISEPINEPINDPINGTINGTIKSLTEVENIVLSIIKGNPSISRKKIVPLTETSEATVRRALKVLARWAILSIAVQIRQEAISACSPHPDD